MYMITYKYYNNFRHDRAKYDRIMTTTKPSKWRKQKAEELDAKLSILDVDTIPDRYRTYLNNNTEITI